MSEGWKYSGRLRPGLRGAGTSGRGIQGREGLLFVQGNTDQINAYLRTKGGEFAKEGFAGAAQINYRLMRELQEDTVEELNKQIIRRNVGTKRLEKALMDDRNAFSSQFGFGVGRPAFLNVSEAKYWRAIEQGTSFFVGRKIQGVWGSSLTGQYARGKTGPWAIPAGPFSPFVEGATGQKLFPMSRSQARSLLGSQGGDGRKGAVRGVINKPITEKRYFQKAWKKFDMRSRSQRIINQMFPAAQRRTPRKKR